MADVLERARRLGHEVFAPIAAKGKPGRLNRPLVRALGDEGLLELGLATRVVEPDSLPGAASELARKLADGPALAYATTKILLTRETDMSLHDAIEMEALAQALLMKSEDFAEFYAAWSEGRNPAWGGR